MLDVRRSSWIHLLGSVMPLRHRDVKAVDLWYANRQSCVNRLPQFFSIEASQVSDVLVRFGERLRQVRVKVGVSQEKLADLAGLHRTYVSSVERGKRNISLLNIDKLAEALGVALTELMPRAKRS